MEHHLSDVLPNYLILKRFCQVGDRTRSLSAEMAAPWGEAIRRLREAKELTRKQLAKNAKMSPTTYGQIERGEHTQTRNLEKIAAALKVDLAEVLVPPRVSLALEERRELAKEIAVDVLRALDDRNRPPREDAAEKKGSIEKPGLAG